MPIVEHYTFLGHVGLVAKLGSFSPDSSYFAQARAELYNTMTDAMSLLCDGYIFLCSWDSQGPSSGRQRQVSN